MAERVSRANKTTRIKHAERLAAAKAEHSRRRADQIARHEIRVQPHFDSMLLVAESSWSAALKVERARKEHQLEALFVPRVRRWFGLKGGIALPSS